MKIIIRQRDEFENKDKSPPGTSEAEKDGGGDGWVKILSGRQEVKRVGARAVGGGVAFANV